MEKKRLAVVADAKNWAFHTLAKLIKKELEDVADVDIFFTKEEPYKGNFFGLIEKIKGYDIIHFLWRKGLMDFESEEFISSVKEHGYDLDEYVSSVCKKISTSVHDHMFLSEEEIIEYLPIFTKYSRKYYTISKKLFDIYSNIPQYPKPAAEISDTFDKALFYPKNLERFENIPQDKPLTLGWVGNSGWNIDDGKGIDYKGLHSILEVVVKDLIGSGYNIVCDFADRKVRFIQPYEMADYYKNVDVYITCSYQEGTPMPVVEGMGCGLPIIATDVGIVPEVFGPLQSEFIIGNREILSDEQIREKLKEAIIKIYNDRTILKRLSDENLVQAKKLDSSNYRDKYIQFFFS